MSVEHEYTIGRRLRKITLKTLVLLFIFSLGFILGDQCSTDHKVDNSPQQFAYIYDTQQKIEDFYKVFERGFSEEKNLPSESPEVEEYMARVREDFGRPLVAVGPFAIFVNNDGSTFAVHEVQSVKQEKGLLLPLVQLKTSEQSKRLRLYSSQEKGCPLPRFNAQFTYSEDGTYEKGSFSVNSEEDGSPKRIYTDSKGVGVLDKMNVFEHEAGILFIYSLDNLTWELVDEYWYSEEEKNRVDGLIKDFHRSFGDREQSEQNE